MAFKSFNGNLQAMLLFVMVPPRCLHQFTCTGSFLMLQGAHITSYSHYVLLCSVL